ncbi:hypothetical protein CKO42_18225 [Lamprobacter modestohalophilus]|uniref:Uncharacterized protein n=1 Tax=Lamprobacter modestohalophilus TaxID=1064514 RepID=A0A9X1B5B6_9GAMM|nr:hypothetical protein [Lamprobacter modestohalophilus]
MPGDLRQGACEAGAELRGAPPSDSDGRGGASRDGLFYCLVRAGSAPIARTAHRLRSKTNRNPRARQHLAAGVGADWLASSVPQRCPRHHQGSRQGDSARAVRAETAAQQQEEQQQEQQQAGAQGAAAAQQEEQQDGDQGIAVQQDGRRATTVQPTTPDKQQRWRRG